MKKLIFFVSILINLTSQAQITGTYQIKGADTVKIWKIGGSVNPNATELILMNSSDTVPGFLWNSGLGVTKFKRPLTKINSTTYLVGLDTLYTGAGGGGSPGGVNANVQINYGSSFVGVPTFIYDTTRKVLVAGGDLNTITTSTNSLIAGQSNISTGTYSSAIGFGNTTGNYGYAFGVGNQVSGYSISVGNGNIRTNGLSSTFGNNLINTYQNALVIGAFNDTTSWPNAALASNTDLFPVFSIGGGSNASARKNVFTILHNGGVIFNLQNNGTLDSVLAVDVNGNLIQKKIIASGGGPGTLDSVGLVMPTGFAVSGSPVTGTGGHITVTTPLSGVVHAGGGNFTASQIVDADVNNVNWSKITSTPTTVTGYGITNAARTDITYFDPSWISSLAWSKITGHPTTLAGYGIIDPIVLTSGSYSNPSWITQLAWSKITGTPTTISGYGITDNLVNSVNGQIGIVVTKSADSIKGLPVDTSVRRNGYFIAFDSVLHKWYLAAGGTGGGSSTFAGLSDVTVSSPLNNQIPVYVTGTGKWTNTSVSTSIISEGSNLYYTAARFNTAFSGKTTDNLSEGTSNLYFTNSRARSAISGASPLIYSSSTGVMSIQVANSTQPGYLTSTDWNTFNSGSVPQNLFVGPVAPTGYTNLMYLLNDTTFYNRPVKILSPLFSISHTDSTFDIGADTATSITGLATKYQVGLKIGFDSVVTITSGSSSTVANGCNVVRFNPTSTISSYTLTLPTTWHVSNDLLIAFTANGTLTNGTTMVTSLTIVNGSGQTLSQIVVPNTGAAGEIIRYHLISGTIDQRTN